MRSNAVVLLLLIVCYVYFRLFVGVLCLYLFCYALLCIHSSFAIILKRKREQVALLLLSFGCLVTVNIMWLLLTVPWAGLLCVIVVFPDHTHLLFLSHTGSELLWSLLLIVEHSPGSITTLNETIY